jgi:hypothetical protein
VELRGEPPWAALRLDGAYEILASGTAREIDPGETRVHRCTDGHCVLVSRTDTP